MKTKKFLFKSLLAGLFVGCSSLLTAQVSSTYGFHQEYGTYTEITDGTVSTVITGDDNGGNLTIPFTFKYNNVNYTTLYANTNGAIFFGGSSTGTSSMNSNLNVIAVLNRDLNGYTSNGAQFSSKLAIDGEDSTFIMQYKNWSVHNNTNTLINFQVHLKPNGVIKLVYGPFSTTTTSTLTISPYIGLRSAAAGDYNLRTNNVTNLNPYNDNINSTFETNTLLVANMSFQANNVLGLPENGLTFVYTPTTCAPIPTLVTTDITDAYFTLNTSTPTDDQYYYEVRTYGGPMSGSNGLVSSGTETFPALISSDMNSATSYKIYVRRICDANSFSNFGSLGVTTACSPLALPLFEGFNSTNMPPCWEQSQVGSVSTTSYLSFVSTSTNPTTAPQEASHFVRFNSNLTASNGVAQRLNTKVIDASQEQDLLVDFNFYQNNTNNNAERVELVYSIDNGTNWQTVGFVNRYNTVNGWKRQLFALPSEANHSSTLKVGLVFHSLGGQNMAVDSFQIRTSPAPIITDFTISNICSTVDQPTIVTLTGKYLQQAVVTINGIVQPILSQSLTEIVFSATPGNDGLIVVTNAQGSATSDSALELIELSSITTDVAQLVSCLGEEKEFHITSDASNYDLYAITFNGSVEGDEIIGYRVSATSSQLITITGTKEVNGTTCHISKEVEFIHTTVPTIAPIGIAPSYCEDEVVALQFLTTLESAVVSGPYNGTTINYNPFYSSWGGFKTQSIYRVNELLAMGLVPGTQIDSLGINYLSTSSTTHVGFRIRIAQVTNTVAPATFLSDAQANWFTVYQDNITPSTPGIQSFTLATPLIWDGVSSIIIETVQSNGGSSQGGTTTVQGENPGFTSYAYRYMDNTSIGTAYTTTTTSSTQNERVKWHFGFTTKLFEPELQSEITWSSQLGSVYLDQALTNVANGEHVNTTYYKVTDQNDQVQVTVVNAPGCSTTHTFNIVATPTVHEQVQVESCNYYVYKGTYLTETGSYTDSLTSILTGCDSLYTLHLTIGNNLETYPSFTTCGSYTFNGTTLTSSGIYTDVFQTSTGCDSTVHLNLTIVSSIEAFVSMSQDTLFAYSTLPGEFYQWENCQTGTIIAGATQPFYVPTEDGIYRVRITNGLCTGTSVCAVFGNAGIDLTESTSVSLYPNPTTSLVTIQYDSNESMQLVVVDATGRAVLSTEIHNGKLIDLSGQAPGVYLFQLSNATSSKMIRVVKQ